MTMRTGPLVTPKTRGLIVNSPANPTGGVLTRSDLERIADLAIRRDLWVLADEIYGRILYDGAEHVSIASLPGMAERTIVLYFSDNGPNSWRWNGGMRGRKGSTDEGGVRSPLLMRWPGHIQRGTTVPEEPAAGWAGWDPARSATLRLFLELGGKVRERLARLRLLLAVQVHAVL